MPPSASVKNVQIGIGALLAHQRQDHWAEASIEHLLYLISTLEIPCHVSFYVPVYV